MTTEKHLEDKIKALREEVKQKRDEFQEDAKEEWTKLEKKWEELNAKLELTKDTADQAATDVTAAAQLLRDELAAGYEKIRSALKA